jgi:hypothetical protein
MRPKSYAQGRISLTTSKETGLHYVDIAISNAVRGRRRIVQILDIGNDSTSDFVH